jgi:very-short-patch-repair endonuclease
MAAGANEWGIDTYLWDGLGIIHFTPIEYWLWHDIRAVDAVLYPQYPAGRFFVDFGNPVAKVAIECDGAAYHTDQAKDASRDAELERLGWTVYRFPGWMCKGDFNEETMESSESHRRMLRIAEEHGIDRKSRTRSDVDDEWEHLGGAVEKMVEGMLRQLSITDAARREVRR